MDEFMLVDSVEEVSQMEVEKVEERDSGVVRWEEFMPKMMIRVLLVEADDSTRHIIAALLRKCNYKVAAVSDGLKAWEILKRRHNNIDLILTEVDLPSISGYALLTLIMEHDSCRNIPVIMMSSTDSMSTVFQCMLKGGADFLIKPVRRNELQNLWQHVWRRISANKGASVQNTSGDDCNVEASSKNGATRICSDDNISSSTQRSEPTKKASNSQGSSQMWHDGVCNLSRNEVHPHDKGLLLGDHTEQERSTRFHSSEELYGDDTFASTFRVEEEGSSERMAEYEKIEVDDMVNGEHEDTKQAIDLIGTIDNHCECTRGEEQQSSSAAPQLELSLRRSNESDKQSDGKQKLNHSNASAFSSYSSSKKLRYSFPSIDSSDEENRSTVMTDPASVVPPPPAAHALSMSSPQASQGAIGLEHSEFDETTNNEEKLASVNQQMHAIASHSTNSTICSQERSTHHHNPLREAALAKFRLKRKERCYEKKVRYQSRKRLAEQRPRVKGQFVRQVHIDQPLDDGG